MITLEGLYFLSAHSALARASLMVKPDVIRVRRFDLAAGQGSEHNEPILSPTAMD